MTAYRCRPGGRRPSPKPRIRNPDSTHSVRRSLPRLQREHIRLGDDRLGISSHSAEMTIKGRPSDYPSITVIEHRRVV